MTRWTIEVDAEVAKRVTEAAADRGVAPEQLLGEAVTERFTPRRRFAFLGMGHSGRTDLSAHIRELRAELAAERADQPRSPAVSEPAQPGPSRHRRALAAADADDRRHLDATVVLDTRVTAQLVLPAPVATEAAWMIGSRLGPATEAAFVASVGAGEFASPS